jgi:uncharacterized LabA/DUF88 family protein
MDMVSDNLTPLRLPGTMRRLAAQRVAVLIDDDNLRIGVAKKSRRIDYAKLLEAVVDGRELFRAILYRPEAKRKPQPFPSGLRYVLERELGVEVQTTEKNADCWIAVDAIALAPNADVIALVGGDTDYQAIVPKLKAEGAKFEVWSWRGDTSERLMEAADEYIPLTKSVLMPSLVAVDTAEAEPANAEAA